VKILDKNLKRLFFYILFVSLILRVVVLILSLPYVTNLIDDIHLQQTGVWLLEGHNPYLETLGDSVRVGFDHMPGWLVYSALIKWISNFLDVSWNLVYRIPYLIIDVLFNAMLIHTAIRLKRKISESLTIGWLYALNPITIISSVVLGQPTMVIMFFIFLAWYYFHFSKGKRWALSAFMFSLAPIWKLLPALLIPALLMKIKTWRKRINYLIVSGISSALLLTPFIFSNKESFLAILRTVFLYFGGGESWGFRLLFEILQSITGMSLFHFLTAFVVSIQKLIILVPFIFVLYICYKRRFSLLVTIYASLLTFVVFRMGFGLHYFSWMVPFFLLINKKKILFLVTSSLGIIFGLLFYTVSGGYLASMGLSESMTYLFEWLMKITFLIAWFVLLKSWIEIVKQKNKKRFSSA